MFQSTLGNAGTDTFGKPAMMTPHQGPPESSISPKIVVVGAALAAGGLFGLFQLGLLPKSWGPLLSKVYFWPTLPFTLVKRISNYWTKMDDTVYLGCAPVGFLGHADSLRSMGVVGVINMCGEYQGPLKDYKRLGIEQLWLPTLDHQEPALADYERGVEFIQRWHDKGGKVLVHCKAGHGRSSAIVMAWLLTRDPKATPHQVQKKMSSQRHVRTYLYRQLHLREFYQSLQTSTDGNAKETENVSR